MYNNVSFNHVHVRHFCPVGSLLKRLFFPLLEVTVFVCVFTSKSTSRCEKERELNLLACHLSSELPGDDGTCLQT